MAHALRCRPNRRFGMSLIEVILATAIAAGLAVILLRYLSAPSDRVLFQASELQRRELDILIVDYEVRHGHLPSRDLRELAATGAIERQLLQCPVDNLPFELDPRTGRVRPHAH